VLLTALEPALLILSYEDLQTPEPDFSSRFDALALHHRVTREWAQKVAMSEPYVDKLMRLPPWTQECRRIYQLNDVRSFILDLIGRAQYVAPKGGTRISAEPAGIVCATVAVPREVVGAWNELLHGCTHQPNTDALDPQIATWESPALADGCETLVVTVGESSQDGGTEIHQFPLVWDEETWYRRLGTMKWWPDLHRCVECCFWNSAGMRSYPEARRQPIPFSYTDKFWDSVHRTCRDESSRDLLIKALTKRVHGILDAGLGDERIGQTGRFRVTLSSRVHYREEDGELVFEEFGSHGIGRLD